MSLPPGPALSIRQPWAWLILHAGKDVENRSWPTRYRGPLLLHASAWFRADAVRSELDQVAEALQFTARALPVPLPSLATLRAQCGRLVGTARLVACVERSASPWFFGPYGFQLAEVTPLVPPVPCKGALGLFDPHRPPRATSPQQEALFP